MVKSPINLLFVPIQVLLRDYESEYQPPFCCRGKCQYKLGDTGQFKLIPGTQTTKTKTRSNLNFIREILQQLYMQVMERGECLKKLHFGS